MVQIQEYAATDHCCGPTRHQHTICNVPFHSQSTSTLKAIAANCPAVLRIFSGLILRAYARPCSFTQQKCTGLWMMLGFGVLVITCWQGDALLRHVFMPTCLLVFWRTSFDDDVCFVLCLRCANVTFSQLVIISALKCGSATDVAYKCYNQAQDCWGLNLQDSAVNWLEQVLHYTSISWDICGFPVPAKQSKVAKSRSANRPRNVVDPWLEFYDFTTSCCGAVVWSQAVESKLGIAAAVCTSLSTLVHTLLTMCCLMHSICSQKKACRDIVTEEGNKQTLCIAFFHRVVLLTATNILYL